MMQKTLFFVGFSDFQLLVQTSQQVIREHLCRHRGYESWGGYNHFPQQGGPQWNKWNAVISWEKKIYIYIYIYIYYYEKYDFLYGLKWPLNGHFKPFRAIRSIRNGFGVQISSSLIPVMSKIIQFEPILKDFDGKIRRHPCGAIRLL